MLADSLADLGRTLLKPRRRHIGEGRKRAIVREQQHRARQAARVAPALAALAEKRKAWARKRSVRYAANGALHLNEGPAHIKDKARESGLWDLHS